jgi:hypothetical protein
MQLLTYDTGFVESTINQLISKRFVKKQQMRWTERGAHLLLQVRVNVLNNDLHSFNGGSNSSAADGNLEKSLLIVIAVLVVVTSATSSITGQSTRCSALSALAVPHLIHNTQSPPERGRCETQAAERMTDVVLPISERPLTVFPRFPPWYRRESNEKGVLRKRAAQSAPDGRVQIRPAL